MLPAGAIIRRVRLATGIVLFAYVTTHFLNHALGLVSLAAMEAGLDWFRLLWTNPAGLAVLYGSLVLHLGLAFWSLYQRRSLRMPGWEAAQLALGLLVPPLLLIHVLGTRLAHQAFGTDATYTYVIFAIWVADPLQAVRQIATLAVAWSHGCIGLHFWLRLRPWYGTAGPYLLALGLLVPLLGVLGFTQAGREVARLAAEPEAFAAVAAGIGFPPPEGVAWIYRLEWTGLVGFALALGATLGARFMRDWLRRHRLVTVTYASGRSIEVTPGTTILDASRLAGIPHASVCGGRGRCSTCRVRVLEGGDRLPSPGAEELGVLERVGAAPNVRLACQTRPVSAVTVMPLLPPTATPRDAQRRPGYLQGHEEEIAVLFADLRAFTRLAENKLPYDVVFLLNRYFRAMGAAVESAGGQLDKFIGDGVMALFGVGGRAEEGCRRALAAARGMAENLEAMNRALSHELVEPLRIGIGINVGPAIVGEMGYGRATSITAIGDVVNTASRLEAFAKDCGCQLVLAEDVALRAGIAVDGFERREVAIRGRAAPLTVRLVADARALPAPAAGREDAQRAAAG